VILDVVPVNTYAVIVGVEQYGPGIPALIGPKIDALLLCLWMLDHQVPAANIQLLLNEAPCVDAAVTAERERLQKLVESKGVVIRTPGRPELERALSAEHLGNYKAQHGSVLWLYWSGHGVLRHTTRERSLLTSDASTADYRAIDVENFSNLLRLEPRVRSLTQQVVIVDACSTWTKPTTPLVALKNPLEHLREQGTRQERIFAAANGESAGIADGELASDFTRTLLTCLKAKTPWSVDLSELRAGLDIELSKCDKRFVMYLEDSNGGVRRTTSGLPNERTGTLANIVSSSTAFPIDTLYRLFRKVTTCSSDCRPKSSKDIVLQLDEFPPDGSGLSNAERFALLLKFRCKRLASDETGKKNTEILSLQEALRQWNAHADQPSLEQARIKLLSQNAEPGRVFIDLGESETRVWIRRDSNWCLVARQADNNKDYLERIRAALSSAIEENISLNNCHIELALNIDDVARAPLGENLSSGSKQKRLGMEVPTTLRIRDRWTRGEIMTNWLAGWNACENLMETNGELVWLDRLPRIGSNSNLSVEKCLSVHVLEQPHVQTLLSNLEDGALWALACNPLVDDAFRANLDDYAQSHALRDWIYVARLVASLSAAGARHVWIVADLPIGLPDGVAEPLQLPI
jgi:hypothetical protein